MSVEEVRSKLRRRDPKFPTVREKMLEGIADPSKLVFLSSLDHANVAYPSRILSGHLRASEVVKQMQSDGVRGVSIMLDAIQPSSDAQAEGGGWALGIGLLPKELNQVLEHEDVAYERNAIRALNTDGIMEVFQRDIMAELVRINVPKQSREAYQLHLYTRLQTVLALYNLAIVEGIQKKHNAAKVITEIRRIFDKYVGADTTWLKRVMQTHLLGNIANAMEELASAGFPVWEMPLKPTDNFFREVGEDGREKGRIYFQDGEFLAVDSKKSIYRKIRKADIFTEMRSGVLVPSAPVMLGAVMVAPEIPHYGNTYGLEQTTAQWLGIDGGGLRLTADNADGSPVGSVLVQGRSKASHVSLDLLHYSRDGFRTVLQAAVEENRPQFDRKFGDIVI